MALKTKSLRNITFRFVGEMVEKERAMKKCRREKMAMPELSIEEFMEH